MQNQPKDILTGPAVGLIITGAFNALLGLLSILSQLLKLSEGGMSQIYANEAERAGAITGKWIVIIVSVMGLLTAPMIISGALRMLKRKNYPMAKVAAVLALLPCTSPCCLLGIPTGIWALVTLNKPEVKASFDGPPINPYNPYNQM